ncbi:MAG: hypothetical protein AAF664_26545, partial [Planctomycetota bacterium]
MIIYDSHVLPWALVGALVIIAMTAWSYRRSTWMAGKTTHTRSGGHGRMILAIVLKFVALSLLVMALLNPRRIEDIPKPGANIVPIIFDTSQSMSVVGESGTSRLQRAWSRIQADRWIESIEETFTPEVYLNGQSLMKLRWERGMEVPMPEAKHSRLLGGLESLRLRMRGRPVAGVVWVTDGNLTDGDVSEIRTAARDLDLPIYPIDVFADEDLADLRVDSIEVQQSNFETSPVRVSASAI